MEGTLDSVGDVLQVQPWVERLILGLFCALMIGQLVLSVRQLSQTADEVTHLYAGYRYLKCSDLTVSPEHPPLAKTVAAVPLLLMNFAVNCTPSKSDGAKQAVAGLNWLYSQNWRLALARARVAVSLFAVGLCLLVWITARQMFDLPTAVTATVLLIFEPNVLAFGALIMTDVPVTCTILFAVYAFYLWVRNRTAPFLLLTALATGLTLLAKHSGLLVVPILCVLAIGDVFIQPVSPRLTLGAVLRNLLAVALICSLAICVVWLGYGMRFAAYPGVVQFQNVRPEDTSITARALRAMKNHHVLPEAYLEGLGAAVSIANRPGPAFVAGKIYLKAPWFSVPFLLLIRNSSAMLALFVTATFGVVMAFGRYRREFMFLLFPAGIFLAVCSQSTMIGGIRYLLPSFPFLLIAVAAGCVELARRMSWVSYGVGCLIVLHVVSSLHAYPNYLSYTNEFWGGPAKAYKYIGWVDLGQAYPQAKTYLERHPAENCWFITGWEFDPKLYSVPCQTFSPYLTGQIPPRVHGTVIISSTLLTDARLAEEALATPFRNIVPKDTIGGSALLVYEGDFDTRFAAARGELNLMVQASSLGQRSVALLHGKRAVELAPDSAYAHASLCGLLAEIGQADAALGECFEAETLLMYDPLREEPTRKKLLDSLHAELTQIRTQYGLAHGSTDSR